MLLTLYERDQTNEALKAMLSTLAETSRLSYQRAIAAFLSFCLRQRETHPYQSAPDAILSYKKYLQTTYSPATVNVYLSAVRAFFKYAMAFGLITHEQYELIKILAPNVRHSGDVWRQWLSKEEAETLFSQTDDSLVGKRDRVALVLLLVLGLRRAEACSVTWEQLIQKEDHWLLINIVGKGNKLRHVEIPAAYVPILQAWQKHNPQGAILTSVDRHGNVHEALNITSLNRIMRKYQVRPHDLRRTAANLILEGGGTMRDVQKVLGHSDLRTTELYVSPMVDLGKSGTKYIRLEVDFGATTGGQDCAD
jgi:integrase